MLIKEMTQEKGSAFFLYGTTRELNAVFFYLPRIWNTKYGLIQGISLGEKEEYIYVVFSRVFPYKKMKNLVRKMNGNKIKI